MSASQVRVVLLVVGPDVAIHEIVAAALQDQCAILGAKTADVALTVAKSRAPSVMILDARVRDRDPTAFVEQMRAIAPQLRVATITSPGGGGSTRELAPLGPVLTTPLDEARLQAVVGSLLRLAAMSSEVSSMRTTTGTGPDSVRLPTRRGATSS